MAELVREILIDATPDTIWPFLTEPGKHTEWEGTVAEIDPRPGGVYRVLVGGEHPSAGEYVVASVVDATRSTARSHASGITNLHPVDLLPVPMHFEEDAVVALVGRAGGIAVARRCCRYSSTRTRNPLKGLAVAVVCSE